MKVILVILGLAAAAVAMTMALISVSWFLNLQVGTRTVIEPRYSQEPLAWEGTVIREGTTYTWGFRWPPRARVTQVQYGLKNLDSARGRFLVGVVFDDGHDSKIVQSSVDLPPAQEATLVFNSPLRGTSTFRFNVSVPTKVITRQQEVEAPRTLGDLIFGR